MKKTILLFVMIFGLTQSWANNIETTVDSTCSVTLTQIQGGFCLLAEATGTAPFTYQWDNGETGQTLCVNNPAGGTFCVTVVDANGCAATACGTLNPNGNNCSVWISQDSTNTNGTLLTAQPTGTAPYIYNWSTGELSPSITVTEDGVYCVTITDDSGCEATSCVTIENDNTPNCSVFIEPTPMGALIAVANGAAPYTYLWSTGETTASIIPTFDGTYCVDITDNTGCMASHCYYYSSGNNDTTCWVTVTQVQGAWCLEAIANGTAPFTYLWDNGETGQTMCPNNPNGGTYCVTVVDASGCAATACGILGNGGGQDSCWVEIVESNIGLTATTNPINTPVTYAWNNGENTQSINPSVEGVYCVTITTTNGCTAEDCHTLNFISEIHGFVVTSIDSMNVLNTNGTVYLIQYDPIEESLTAVDEVNFAQGYFEFNDVAEGQYLVKAALGPNAVEYEEYLPTYFDEVLWWDEATTLEVEVGTVYTLQINMIEGDNPGGPGFIGGLVSEGANFSGGADHRGEGDPLENVTMLLLDENDNPIAHASTNAEGEYEFDNLAWGTYKVYIEIPGIEHVMYLVTIGPENPSVDNLDFLVDDDSAATVSIKNLLEENSIEVFPNPANEKVNLQFVVKEHTEMIFSLMSANGKTIIAETAELYPGIYTHSFNVEHFPAGLYFINIIDGDETISCKVIKK